MAGKEVCPKLSGRMIFGPESNKHFGVSGFRVHALFLYSSIILSLKTLTGLLSHVTNHQKYNKTKAVQFVSSVLKTSLVMYQTLVTDWYLVFCSKHCHPTKTKTIVHVLLFFFFYCLLPQFLSSYQTLVLDWPVLGSKHYRLQK